MYRMGIPNERTYLKGAFPDGIALATAFVGASQLAQLEAGVEEALAAGEHFVLLTACAAQQRTVMTEIWAEAKVALDCGCSKSGI